MADESTDTTDTATPITTQAATLEDHIAELQAQLAAATAALAAQNAPAPPPPPAVPVTVTCPACGDIEPAPGGDAEYLLKGISRCTKCGARIVYGEVAPRCVLEPTAFVNSTGSYPAFVLRIQDGVTKGDVYRLVLDPQHGFLVAQAIIGAVQA